MTDTRKAVGNTADGLVILRASPVAQTVGVEDPFAAWFVTDAGYKLAGMAKALDCVYEPFNLARFRYTSEALTRSAATYKQMVLLGSGFDGRAWWLDGLREGGVQVYEAETQAKLDQKLDIFREHGVALPPWVHPVAVDLREPDVRAHLIKVGFEPDQPALVLAEGVFYYLPTETALHILHPNWLGLKKGSRLVFDCWSVDRINDLNIKVAERMGTRLFQVFPFATHPENLSNELYRLGYANVSVTALGALAEHYFGRAFSDPYPDSWWMVEAVV